MNRHNAVVVATVLLLLAAVVTAAIQPRPGAIPPAPIDAAFKSGDDQAVTDAITGSDTFKRAVSEAVKARDARAAEIADKPSTAPGIRPEQAARVRFIEVLQGK